MKKHDALCLFRGFTSDEISEAVQAATAFAHEAGFTITDLYAKEIYDSNLDTKVSAYLEGQIRTALSKEGTEDDGIDTATVRVVLILTNDKQRLFKIMRGIKSVSENPGDIIFASITETAMQWTFRYYFSHLSEEHEYMKTHTPEGDPDMKAEIEK